MPDARPGDELVWSRDGDSIVAIRPLPKLRASAIPEIPLIKAPRTGLHPVLTGVKTHFEAGRLSYEGEYLKPAKRLLPDFVVTKAGIDKALSFANELFLSLEESGHRVVIAPHGEYLHREEVDEREISHGNKAYNNLWSPGRSTVVYVGTVAIGMTIIEMSEEVEMRYVNGKYIREDEYVLPKSRRNFSDNSWTTKKQLSSGRLCLQAYSPYARAKWLHHWKEANGRDLKSQIKGIVQEFERSVIEISRLVEEASRQIELERQEWEEQSKKWHREEEERRAAKALKESKDDILRIIDNWDKAKRIEQFISDIERRTAQLRDDQLAGVLERLKIARELFGSADALEHFLSWRSPAEHRS